MRNELSCFKITENILQLIQSKIAYLRESAHGQRPPKAPLKNNQIRVGVAEMLPQQPNGSFRRKGHNRLLDWLLWQRLERQRFKSRANTFQWLLAVTFGRFVILPTVEVEADPNSG